MTQAPELFHEWYRRKLIFLSEVQSADFNYFFQKVLTEWETSALLIEAHAVGNKEHIWTVDDGEEEEGEQGEEKEEAF